MANLSHDASLLLGSLPVALASLGGGVDELEASRLESNAALDRGDSLAQGDDALDGTHDRTLDHDEVLVDHTVLLEATHRSDGLESKVGLSGSVVVGNSLEVGRESGSLLAAVEEGTSSLADAVDLLVELGAVEVTLLTSTSNGAVNASRVPCTNASDLTKTTVGLTRKTSDTEAADDTSETLTAGHTDEVNHLVLAEDGVNGNLLLEKRACELNLLSRSTTVDLDLNKVSLLETEAHATGLGVSKDAHNLAVLGDLGKILLGRSDSVALLVSVRSVLLDSVAVEGHTLDAVPVLVEAALHALVEVLREDSLEGTKTRGGLDVTDNTADNHGRSLKDGDSLNSLLVVETRANTLNITLNVSHARLVADEGSEVGSIVGVVLGESLDAALVGAGASAGRKCQRTVTRCGELAVRHFFSKEGVLYTLRSSGC